ncbi:C40 family peptidase [Litchfieldia salsa]|uniref:Putative peptidoglycan binding domain-containing protein n=1 Tax=Litchfieldia salsa TaxID=930152 RepID=A0A1H0TGN6_9BACI|nr:peptidoglycan-binding protein [Litchfieldia salsa]SDP53144.1 Putative peptidoglycan binding domain-containing protein [Litchfieldia salsa]
MRMPIRTKETLLVTSVAAAGLFFATPEMTGATSQTELSPKNYYDNFFDTESTLRYGHTGHSVRILQLELMKINFYFEQIDGYYGPNTQEAVRKFQQAHKLNIDGVAGSETLSVLNDVLTKPKPEILSIGDEGPEVEQLQTRLQRLGYYHGPIDGIFGKLTEKSVLSYQEKHKLDLTATATDETTHHLLKNKNVKGIRINTIASASKRQGESNSTSTMSVTTSNSNSQAQEKPVPKEQNYSVDSTIISVAIQHVGTPYVWGGSSPGGFDCSGFLKYVFSQKNVNIPRTVNEIWNIGTSVEKLSVGDLVFFQTYTKGPSHAGIYIGDGKFIHSESSRGVTVTNMSMSYWQDRYLGAKRIVQYK